MVSQSEIAFPSKLLPGRSVLSTQISKRSLMELQSRTFRALALRLSFKILKISVVAYSQKFEKSFSLNIVVSELIDSIDCDKQLTLSLHPLPRV